MRHAYPVHPVWYEALLTMYQIPLGGVKIVRWTPSGKPYPGKGQGSDDMISISKCLQHREREQAKKAVKLEPKRYVVRVWVS